MRTRFALTFALTFSLAACDRTAPDATADQATGTQATGARGVEVEDARGTKVRIADTSRIVSLKGSATEIVYALGAGDRLVGVDTTSVYPPEANAKAKVGFPSKLAAEGVLSLRPSLVLFDESAGPAPVLEQLRGAGLTLLEIPSGYDVASAKRRITLLGEVFGEPAEATALIEAMDADLAKARAIVARATTRPKVLFVYARGQKVLQVAGKGTPAQTMLDLAGGENVFAAVEGFAPMTAEAVVAAAPEILLMLDRSAESVGGHDAVWALPGIAETPAGKARRAVLMDDAELLGFGPRLGAAAVTLAEKLHHGDQG